jgi:hypothetical protein
MTTSSSYLSLGIFTTPDIMVISPWLGLQIHVCENKLAITVGIASYYAEGEAIISCLCFRVYMSPSGHFIVKYEITQWFVSIKTVVMPFLRFYILDCTNAGSIDKDN